MRTIVTRFRSTPIFGLLGPSRPEAYHVNLAKKYNDRSDSEGGIPDRVAHGDCDPFYVLGPYDRPTTAGCDYLTRKSVPVFLEFLTKYAAKGDIIFESAMTSHRFSAPTIGQWLLDRKDDVIVVVLDVSPEDCIKSLHTRQAKSGRASEKLIHEQQRQFELVLVKIKELGFRMEYVTRDNAVERILAML